MITNFVTSLFGIYFVCIFVTYGQENPPIFVDQGLSPEFTGCNDSDTRCAAWADEGECQINAAWMMINCKRSCQSCQGGDVAWKLRNEIAAKYENRTVTEASGKFIINRVKINSIRVSHFEIDETTQLVNMHGKMILTWNDSRIAWDKTKWKLSWLNFYWSQSWAPTLIQTNAPPSNQGSVKASLTAANYTGQLYAWVDFTFKTLCDFDYSSYPYDAQTCCYKLEDKQYYSVEFLLANSIETDAIASARRLHPSGWTVEKVTVRLNNYQAEVRQDWSHDPFHVFTNNVDVCATFGRDSSYANAELVGPAIAPALITLISFFVGDFRTQIYLLVTSVGLQMVSSICVQFRLPPPSGETPAFLKFCTFNLTMTSVLLAIVAILLSMASHETFVPPPNFVSKFVWFFEKCSLCSSTKSNDGHDDTNAIVNSATVIQSKNLWSPLAAALKRLIFIICLCLYILLLLTCFAK